jgi:hypothetical protein
LALRLDARTGNLEVALANMRSEIKSLFTAMVVATFTLNWPWGKGAPSTWKVSNVCAILTGIIALTVQATKLCNHAGADFLSCAFCDSLVYVRTAAPPANTDFTSVWRSRNRPKSSRAFRKNTRSPSATKFRNPIQLFEGTGLARTRLPQKTFARSAL